MAGSVGARIVLLDCDGKPALELIQLHLLEALLCVRTGKSQEAEES
jgi:hypothetical protein